jgi:hypothetical protein
MPLLPQAWKTPPKPRAQPEQTRQQYQPTPADDKHEHALRTNSVDQINHSESVTDAEKDQSLVSQLDYMTWLPFAAKKYVISPRIEDYLIVSTLICPSEIPNRNGIAFPTSELATFRPPPTNRMAYKAWTGCPVCFEHRTGEILRRNSRCLLAQGAWIRKRQAVESHGAARD